MSAQGEEETGPRLKEGHCPGGREDRWSVVEPHGLLSVSIDIDGVSDARAVFRQDPVREAGLLRGRVQREGMSRRTPEKELHSRLGVRHVDVRPERRVANRDAAPETTDVHESEERSDVTVDNPSLFRTAQAERGQPSAGLQDLSEDRDEHLGRKAADCSERVQVLAHAQKDDLQSSIRGKHLL